MVAGGRVEPEDPEAVEPDAVLPDVVPTAVAAGFTSTRPEIVALIPVAELPPVPPLEPAVSVSDTPQL